MEQRAPQSNGARRLGEPREHHPSIDSTNRRALELADSGAPHGAIVTADHQTMGRGRLGRAWVDEPGANLLVSVILRPTTALADFGWISLAAGLAVSDSVISLLSSPDTEVRWPNDVLVGGRKIAGVLAESRLRGASPYVVLGIGLNVNQTIFPDDLATPATSIARESGRSLDLEALLGELLECIDRRMSQLEVGRVDELAEATVPRLAGLHETVSVRIGNEVIVGTHRGLGDGGSLQVETPSGMRAIHSGDIIHRARGVAE